MTKLENEKFSRKYSNQSNKIEAPPKRIMKEDVIERFNQRKSNTPLK